MPTTTRTERASDPVALADTCDVCCVRRAVWMSVAHGRDFVVCAACREGEPCDRCGVEHVRCACSEGPDVLAWVPIAAQG